MTYSAPDVIPMQLGRIKVSDIGPKRKKPCTHCGTSGRDLCKEGCFMGALYQTNINFLSSEEITAMHTTCLRTFPDNSHASEYEKGNTCQPKKK